MTVLKLCLHFKKLQSCPKHRPLQNNNHLSFTTFIKSISTTDKSANQEITKENSISVPAGDIVLTEHNRKAEAVSQWRHSQYTAIVRQLPATLTGVNPTDAFALLFKHTPSAEQCLCPY